MAHGQGGAEIRVDGAPSLTCNHEAPIVFSDSGLNGQDAYTGRVLPVAAYNETPWDAQEKRIHDVRRGVAPTLSSRSSGGGTVDGWFASPGMAVRRLVPVECERLQGFPDEYTRIPWKGKPASECPDGPRYKALGNSMAVPVMRWIGERIAKVEEV